MTLTSPNLADDLAHHKKTHLTMKDGLGCQPVKWDKLFFAIEFDAGSKGALFQPSGLYHRISLSHSNR